MIEEFKKNDKRNYDFLVKASTEYQEAFYELCKRIIEDESVPENFREKTLHQIWKKKPGTRKEDLDANRYIHCKHYLPRAVKAIVVAQMESSITAATSSRLGVWQAIGHKNIYSVSKACRQDMRS